MKTCPDFEERHQENFDYATESQTPVALTSIAISMAKIAITLEEILVLLRQKQ